MVIVSGETEVRIQIAAQFCPPAQRIVVVARPDRSGRIQHFANAAEMVAGVEIISRGWPARELHALVEETFFTVAPVASRSLAQLQPAPDEAPLVHRRAVLLFDDTRAPAEAVVVELAAIGAAIDRDEAMVGVPFISRVGQHRIGSGEQFVEQL